ncbi:Hypothetical protein FKW44_009558, partial [Caligus rogercresseyi]
LKPNEIRAIILAAAARYTAFKVKIPQEDNTNWTLAIIQIKYLPTMALQHKKFLIQITLGNSQI